MRMVILFSCLFIADWAGAQVLNVSAGTDLTIIGGTVFRAEDLTLTPSANYVITNNSLTRSATILHASSNSYISKVYQFANITNPYSGSLQINFSDGAELNGIPEGALTLNIHNGTSWTAYPIATRDGTNNFVLTTGLSNVLLNEMTLADLAKPLPLIWISFTAINQNNAALLEWVTEQERNTRNFTVQHSGDGINWAGIATLPATGTANGSAKYHYVHTSPLTGLNYYRILQTDLDNRKSYSDIASLRFTATSEDFVITGNPVKNDLLIVQVNTATVLALYNADGKLAWRRQVNAGIQYIDVSGYAKGIYFLKSNTSTKQVVVQ